MVSVAHSWNEPGTDPVGVALDSFSAATRELLDSRELLRRIDSKYVVHASRIAALVSGLGDSYACLRVPTGSVATYRSLYFDSPDLRCFHDHRRGRRLRHKIRVRHYPDREVSFLEVKTKRNEELTEKRRLALPYGCEQLDARELEFLRKHTGVLADALAATVRIEFRRVTLIGLATNERMTIDVDLETVELSGVRHSLGPIAIVEVKQSPFSVRTPAMRALYRAGQREQSLSKYIAAIATAFPAERMNRLLPDLRAVARIAP